MLLKTNIVISEIELIIKNIDTVLSQIRSEVDLLNTIAEHISGGKRLRPILLITTARSLNFDDRILYDAACVVEYIHIASLLHDDVIDNAQKRRNKPSVNSLFGEKTAIMAGDYLYSLAYNKVLDIDTSVAKEISKAAHNLALGEIKEIENFNKIISFDDYYDIIYKKTACLIESACVSGALLAGVENIEDFRNYGKNLGLSFQIKDDIMDYASSTDIGKDTFNDIKEGKTTLPLLIALKKDSNLKNIVNNYFETKDESLKSYIINSVLDNAIDESYKIATKNAQLAKKAIGKLSNSVHKDILMFLADYAISRQK